MKKILSAALLASCLMVSIISTGAVTHGNSKDYDFIDEFSEGYAIVGDGNLYGFIDETGAEVTSLAFEDALGFAEGFANVVQGGLCGYIDTTGEVVIPCIYDNANGFREGIAGVMLGGKCGAIDTTGTMVIPCIYDGLGISYEGMTRVVMDEMYGYCDKEGNLVIPTIYDYVGDFVEGLSTAYVGDLCGFIDKTGQVVVPFLYDKTSDFFHGYAMVVLDDQYGCVDKTGTLMFPCAYTFDEAWAQMVTFMPDYATTEESSATETVEANPTASKVIMDGSETTFDSYDIGDNTYFKLRDVACILSGTEGQFGVAWDGELSTIYITSGAAYTQVGGEMAKGDGTSKTCNSTASSIYLDGELIELAGYHIGGNNYFKLTDLGEALGFDVSWNQNSETYDITTRETYTAD